MQRVVDQSGLVVMIAAVAPTGATFLGSGLVCSLSGHILTCAHLLELTASLHISVPPAINSFAPMTAGRTHFSSVSVVQIDAKSDLALLKLSDQVSIQMMPNLFGRGETTPVGTAVGCLGIPFGDKGHHTLKLTSTIICGKSVSPTGAKQLHLDANMHSGNSGGPVINPITGQVIGLVSGRFSPVGPNPGIMIGNVPLGADSTISFAIPIEHAFPLMQAEGINV